MPSTLGKPANCYRSRYQRLVNTRCQLTLIVVLLLEALVQAQTFTTLYNFTGGSDGAWPYAGVIQGPSGNLYGTTFGRGSGYGVVYELNTAGTETVRYSFTGGLDGSEPYTPVTRDEAGNIYGATYGGGTADRGTVFKIDTKGNETVLHSFTGGTSDGCHPDQGLLVGKFGTLFGTTNECGSSGYGTIFKINSAGNETILHSFVGSPSDGAYPYLGHLAMDKFGNLYGVTSTGGAANSGALYKLNKGGTLTLLHSFSGGTSDGCDPHGSVVLDEAGNLYGTTYSCGSNGYGTLWKASKKGKETILHNFADLPSDGCLPDAGVARDSKGNLYGVTSGCGAFGGNYGALYEFGASSGSGKITLLHSFGLSASGVAVPVGELLRTSKGALFGTTVYDGTYGYGTVWSYAP
jgi:uncharacterized repeat protein (TIGR03803 family)